jgi:DNA-binding transcriptional MerR regulator
MPSLYNINQTGKACGLSPSVLRIWELRYGWPKPERQPNGYRAYSQYQVQLLRRVAELVRSGMPIRAIIIDGRPRLPSVPARRRPPQGLQQTRQLPKPVGEMEAKLQQELIETLEKRITSLVKELLQRAFWQVHPKDEVLTALAPILVGLAELIQDKRPLAGDVELRRLIKDRCLHHLRRFQTTVPEVWVIPATADDQALAALVALILNHRGQEAQIWTQAAVPPGRILLVADRDPPATVIQTYPGAERLSAVGGESTKNLLELCNTTA